MPTVSVITPTYNRDAVVARAIDSVLTQTYDNYEIVVVDDCSTDNTRAVVEGYDDDRVRYVRHDENRGACAARNTGIEHSNGRYVAFLDSDDEWDETKLAEQVKCMKSASESVGVVYTGYQVKRSDHVELGQVPSKRGDIYYDQLAKDWVSPTSAVMVDRDCFESVGMFDTNLNARQDYDMWIRISREFEFEYVSEVLVTQHTDTDNRITGQVESRIEAHKKVLEKIEEDIHELSILHRKRIISSHYFTIGRYFQRSSQSLCAVKYFIKSIFSNPVKIKSWASLLFILTLSDPDSGVGLRIKNYIKSMKVVED